MKRSLTFQLGRPELRRAPAGEAGVGSLAGYAAKYNVESEELWGFREMIAPGAFDGVLQDDVRALFNHDWSMVLGRTAAGTLRLSVDEVGLRYEVDLPDTSFARDLFTSVERGDINQSSFGFTVAMDGEQWVSRDRDVLRVITRVERLYDVSPVALPAYPDATVGVRGGAPEIDVNR